jgi:hypothetical protein
MANTIPARSPEKEHPICHRPHPYMSRKIRANAPKKRYKIPSKIAENMHKQRHIGSKAKS